MSEHEAIEYRLARVKQAIDGLAGMVQLTVGAIFLIGMIVTTDTLSIMFMGMTVVTAFAGFRTLINAAGCNSRGSLRTIGQLLGATYPDPPFNDWLESLEDRNAFPVDGDTA
jgi:hypothetical protein